MTLKPAKPDTLKALADAYATRAFEFEDRDGQAIAFLFTVPVGERAVEVQKALVECEASGEKSMAWTRMMWLEFLYTGGEELNEAEREVLMAAVGIEQAQTAMIRLTGLDPTAADAEPDDLNT